MQSRNPSPSMAQAEAAVTRLISACQPLAAGKTRPAKVLDLNGGFIARFLTQKED